MRVFQYCGNCGEQYSASSGDYWYKAGSDEQEKCGNCGYPLMLGTQQTVIAPVAASTVANMEKVERGEIKPDALAIVPVELLARIEKMLRDAAKVMDIDSEYLNIADEMAPYI